MVSDPRTVCGRGEGRAVAAQGEEGARAEQSLVLRRAGAARDGATGSDGLLAPTGDFPHGCQGPASRTVRRIAGSVPGCPSVSWNAAAWPAGQAEGFSPSALLR